VVGFSDREIDFDTDADIDFEEKNGNRKKDVLIY